MYKKNTKNSEDNKMIIKINFFVIRAIINIIKDTRINNNNFYDYLLGISEFNEQQHDVNKRIKSDGQTVMNTAIIGNGSCDTKYTKKLIEYGISPEFFDNQFIVTDSIFLEDCTNYFKDKKNIETIEKKELEKDILNIIFDIKNLDGSLVIDCIRNLMLDYLLINPEQNENLYNLTQNIIDIQPTGKKHLTQKQLKDYYNDTAKSFCQSNDHEFFDDFNLPDGKMASNKIFGSSNFKGDFSLYLIRETYKILAEIDDVQDAMKKFYSYLDISEKEYQDMIDTKIIPNKKIFEKLKPFKYPASLFRGEFPSDYDISHNIKNAYDDFYIYKNFETFNNYLKLYLCYKISTDNINLIIPTCALLNAIKDKYN